jgi:hypothetical protein
VSAVMVLNIAVQKQLSGKTVFFHLLFKLFEQESVIPEI